ncbi:CLUMA_CG003370, isoform A [Clunio marinus]|uniref:CLUMA_CG003370, isoform A n=1 Tax=Clunio marinus TaxID=568069 RepID=A0A1J1HNX0_9DIPT|nr:CLUMA_CG003370, isoform A [Clunio marinus]
MAGEVTAEAGRIPKPILRGLHNAQIKRNLVIAGVLVTVVTVAVKYLRNEPRKRDYAEFYKTYDPEKSFKRMVDAGLLQSVKEL